MILSQELADWRSRGQLVRIAPLSLNVFTMDIGSVDAKASETCLLLHGFPESSFSFHKVVDSLSQQFKRVVLVDLPGYGFSDKPDTEYSYSLIDQADVLLMVWNQLSVRGGHIIAHDMGTSVLTELLTRYVRSALPCWFEGSIESATFTNGSMVLRYARLRMMQKLLLNPLMGSFVSSQARFSLFQRTVVSAHGAQEPHQLSNSDIRCLWESCVIFDGHKKNHLIIRYLNDRKRFETTRWIPSLALASEVLPIHLCWGDADQVATIEMARHLKSQLTKNAVLTEMRGAGHFCQLGSPDLWSESILPFFEFQTK